MLGWRIFQHVHLYLEGIEFAQLTRVFFIAFENSTSMIDRFLCWSVGNHRAQLCCPRLPTHHSGKQTHQQGIGSHCCSCRSTLPAAFTLLSLLQYLTGSPLPTPVSVSLPVLTNVLSLTWTAVPSVWGLPTGRTSYQQRLLLSYV